MADALTPMQRRRLEAAKRQATAAPAQQAVPRGPAPRSAAAIDWGNAFRRQDFAPLDLSYVFASVADLEDYLTSDAVMTGNFADIKGYPYPGQISAVLNGTNQPDVYVVWQVPSGTVGAVENPLNNLFYAYSQIGGGAVEGITTGSMTAPSNPQPGDLWTRPDNRMLFRLDTGAWVQIWP
jgi:triacylglycerol esterase/lipase EstA (alpha/beta hydrolase family)